MVKEPDGSAYSITNSGGSTDTGRLNAVTTVAKARSPTAVPYRTKPRSNLFPARNTQTSPETSTIRRDGRNAQFR